MIKLNKKTILLTIFVLLLPVSYSNGGCIKIAEDVYVQLSNSPLVPIVDKEESFLISFGNNTGLINEEIDGKLKIVKSEEMILTKNFQIKNGLLDLKHTFKNSGLYEIFLDFKIGNKTYTPEDFLIEVKEEKQNPIYNIIILITGIFIGAVLMKLFNK